MNITVEDPHKTWLQEAVSSYEGRLIHYARQFVGDWETARDVAQDAFLRLCQQPKAKVGDPPGPWLYRVARNRALDICRKRRRHPEETFDAAEETVAQEARPDDRAARVWETLNDLTPKQQEVVRLKFLHGLSYKEISRVTGLSTGNVGFIIHTAVRQLRDRLHEAPGTESNDKNANQENQS